MAFNKAAVDVISKGLDPTQPHKTLGSDGMLQQLEKSAVTTKTIVFPEELTEKSKAYAAKLAELEEQIKQHREQSTEEQEENVVIVKKRPGRPKKIST